MTSSPNYSPSWPGRVVPLWTTRRSPERPTFGPAVAKLAALLGRPLMPWQAAAADVALELNEIGEWAYPTVVLHMQRQAGKTLLILPAAVHRGLTVPDVRTWYTAQTRNDARDNFIQMMKLVRRSALRAHAKIRESNGSESLSLPTGSTFGVFAPSEDALHGKANALVVIDEGWSFSELAGRAMLQAILPTFATVDGQLWVISAGGTAESAWFRSYVEQGRAAVAADRREGLCYVEYGVPDDALTSDGLLTPELVMAHHPAAGHTLRPAAVRMAYEKMDPGEFARAWGNRWTTVPEYAIDQARWRGAAATVELPAPGTVALAFDVALDGADATICAAWRLPSGAVHVEVVAHDRGSLWLPDRMATAIDRWAPRLAIGYDTRGPATDAADKISRAGVPLLPLSTVDLTAACPATLAALTATPPQQTYTAHPALDAAAAAAARRKVGDLWVWGRRASAGSISALVALTLAAWTLDHAPQEPEPTRFEIL